MWTHHHHTTVPGRALDSLETLSALESGRWVQIMLYHSIPAVLLLGSTSPPPSILLLTVIVLVFKEKNLFFILFYFFAFQNQNDLRISFLSGNEPLIVLEIYGS